jgi:hypothetical protein
MGELIPVREFWERKVDNVFMRFQYTGDTREFVAGLARLGYSEEKVEAILDNWMESIDG